MPLIDGKLIAQKILADASVRVKKLKRCGIIPVLAVILVGNDKPSRTYVKKKGEAAKKVGIAFVLKKLPARVTEEKIIQTIMSLQKRKTISGLIVQLPLPRHIDTDRVLSAIKPDIDVDCLTPANTRALNAGNPIYIPPTPGAALSILKHLGVNPKNKKIIIFGRGALVGKPLAILLQQMGGDVTVIHSKSTNVKKICRTGDIIISGVGKKHLITGDMVRKGAIVIDAGTSFHRGKIYGDVDAASVKKIAGFVTPTPGGVGPITVARLLLNVVIAATRSIPS